MNRRKINSITLTISGLTLSSIMLVSCISLNSGVTVAPIQPVNREYPVYVHNPDDYRQTTTPGIDVNVNKPRICNRHWWC